MVAIIWFGTQFPVDFDYYMALHRPCNNCCDCFPSYSFHAKYEKNIFIESRELVYAFTLRM